MKYFVVRLLSLSNLAGVGSTENKANRNHRSRSRFSFDGDCDFTIIVRVREKSESTHIRVRSEDFSLLLCTNCDKPRQKVGIAEIFTVTNKSKPTIAGCWREGEKCFRGETLGSYTLCTQPSQYLLWEDLVCW